MTSQKWDLADHFSFFELFPLVIVMHKHFKNRGTKSTLFFISSFHRLVLLLLSIGLQKIHYQSRAGLSIICTSIFDNGCIATVITFESHKIHDTISGFSTSVTYMAVGNCFIQLQCLMR